MIEDQSTEYKSLKKAIGRQSDVESLAETCVCLANAQGGQLIIGIENGESEPPFNQDINQEDLNKLLSRLRSLTDGVGIATPEIVTAKNGGKFIRLIILPSARTIATTSSGKVFIRISDNCFPVSGDELTNLASEKNAFQWELVTPFKMRLTDADQEKINSFVADIRKSPKVSEFIRDKEPEEILTFYRLLTEEGYLTNLGILWLGKAPQRSRLSYPITVQYIVYNAREEKVRKADWHFNLHTPKELLFAIENEAVELTYSIEINEGLFRRQVRQYPKEVIRELLINAFAHKRYTMSGDIFIEVYPNRLTITSPGGFPLGINKDNVLHERHRRNPHLIQTLHDLNLMEGEGSGFDLIYEKLTRDAKPLPEIDASINKVSVTVFASVVDTEILSILDHIASNFQLSQKEFIALGIVALERKILSTKLAQKLQLQHEDRMRAWIGGLTEKSVIISRGVKKGTEYLLNPELFAHAKLGIRASLKTIDPHKLEALIEEDLRYNGVSKMSDIQARFDGVLVEDIRKAVYKMAAEGRLDKLGADRNRSYMLAKKK